MSSGKEQCRDKQQMVGARLLTVGVRLQTSRGMASALVTLDLGFLGG